MSMEMARRAALQALVGIGIGGATFHRALASAMAMDGEVTREMIQQAQWVAEVELTEEQQEELAKSLKQLREGQKALQALEIDADIPMAMAFVPHFFAQPPVIDDQARTQLHVASIKKRVEPDVIALKVGDEPLAFQSIALLGEGLRRGKWTSLQLTQMYLDRLKKYDPLLHCVISLTESMALEQAGKADEELKRGFDRGPLHGIPWGAKDLIAIPGYKTTWGAAPYKEQVREKEATVAKRLRESGAVLVAKLSLGAMAWGDVWYDATTRNPWNPKQGSSGSSAGSASATVAGLCGFAIGSETLGSIISPTRRCRVTGLRPTFGRVSRAGCMALAWSMDKIGPIARTVEDCALIFAAIAGGDGLDPTVVDRPFHWPIERDWKKLKIGVGSEKPNETEQMVLDLLKEAGAELVPIKYPDHVPESGLLAALATESGTMFEDLYRKGTSDRDLGNWGPTFREAQWIRAVHYVRGMRARVMLIQETEKALQEVDVVVGGDDLVRTNLTGHPSLNVAFDSEEGRSGPVPRVVKLTSKFFGEDLLLHVGDFIQRSKPAKPNMPPLDRFLTEMAQSEEKIETDGEE